MGAKELSRGGAKPRRTIFLSSASPRLRETNFIRLQTRSKDLCFWRIVELDLGLTDALSDRQDAYPTDADVLTQSRSAQSEDSFNPVFEFYATPQDSTSCAIT